MKIKLIDENNIIVFLSSYKIKILDINSKSELENELKELFRNINSIFNLELHGYYNVSIYVDDKYGLILNLIKEEIDYMDYDISEVDMRIIVYREDFIYRIYDFIELDGNYDIYKYKDKYYLKLNSKLNNYNMGKLLEYSEVIYDKTDEIIKYGNILKNKSYVL